MLHSKLCTICMHFCMISETQPPKPNVFMVAPFTTKDLSQRSMADVIFDLNDLTQLYPNIQKENFRKFCSAAQGQNVPSANGYVKHMLVTHVEGYDKSMLIPSSHEYLNYYFFLFCSPSGMDSNPPTPNMGYDVVASVGSQQDAQ